ncbi:MAG: CoA transferase [Chloroflexi bacterium]|nr:CoA transferase [Chloroflexota bacterium]
MTTEGTLTGLKVVELGSFVAAPFGAKLLADQGADVVKVEPPGGDLARRIGPWPGDVPHPEKSGLFLYLNHNKLGVTLDVRAPTGRDILKRLLQGADVLVEASPPKVMEELGLDYVSLSRLNPRLIVTSITPWGQSGPYRDHKGYDLNCVAAGNVAYGVGYPDREPLAMPFWQGDHQAGLSAAGATVAALFARDRTGKGQHVDVAEAEVMACFFAGMYVPTYVFQGITGNRLGWRSGLGLFPQTILKCKDGWICLNAPQLEQWIRFVKLMSEPEWTKDPRYRNRRAMGEEYPAEVEALLAPWFESRTKEEIFNACRQAHIPFAPVRTVDDLLADPQLRHRDFFVEVEHPEAGTWIYPSTPFKLSEAPPRIRRPAPRLGEHNEEVYCGRLGYSRRDLTDLRRTGVI